MGFVVMYRGGGVNGIEVETVGMEEEVLG